MEVGYAEGSWNKELKNSSSKGIEKFKRVIGELRIKLMESACHVNGMYQS